MKRKLTLKICSEEDIKMKLSKLFLIPCATSFMMCGCFNPTPATGSDGSVISGASISLPSSLDIDDVEFEGLNYLLKKEYTTCKIDIKTTKSGSELKTHYDVAKEGSAWKIAYSKQRYATIDPAASNPESAIVTDTGENSYAENPYSLEKYVCSKETFDSYFFGSGLFEARLVNGKTFLNSSFNANKFALNINFSVNIIDLEIKYSLDDNTIVLINYQPVY